MDAHNHLKRLGWKGSGYSLGRSNSGITKPILISHKNDFLGLGAKQRKEKQADQWWLRAFDSALQDFGTDKQV
jgi:nucleolar protein TMA23